MHKNKKLMGLGLWAEVYNPLAEDSYIYQHVKWATLNYKARLAILRGFCFPNDVILWAAL